jgi:hypothetical protein
MKRVEFDPETHTYEGGTLPSVTEVLRNANLIETAYGQADEYLLRGRAVHLACQLWDEGDLDESSVDPAILGYFEAYKNFKQDLAIEPTWIETPIKNGLYAGTPDRIMTARPRRLWDLKSGAYQAYHRLQTAAYINLLDDPFSYSRAGLYLKPDGRYSVREFPKSEYLSDLNTFLSALNLYNWRKLYGC